MPDQELITIKSSLQKHFGGNIDLYIETELSEKEAVQGKIRFDAELMMTIGEQRIDTVLNLVHSNTDLPIYEIAKETGIVLI